MPALPRRTLLALPLALIQASGEAAERKRRKIRLVVSVDRFASLLAGIALQVASRDAAGNAIPKPPYGDAAGGSLRPDTFGRIRLAEIELDPDGTLVLTVRCPDGAVYQADCGVPTPADGTAHVLVKPAIQVSYTTTSTAKDAGHVVAVTIPLQTLSGIIASPVPSTPSISG